MHCTMLVLIGWIVDETRLCWKRDVSEGFILASGC
jgi:hypothetical protein